MQPPTPPSPPRRRQAFSVYGGAVTTEGAAREAQAVAELFRVDDTLARALTHGFHSYAARLHPSIARGAIARFSRPGQRVLDPFCGSGTVVVEALAAGRRAQGIDASPLALAIAQTRSTVLGPDRRQRLAALAESIAVESADRARARKRPDAERAFPAWSRAERAHFAPHVLLELLGLRALIADTRVDDDDVARALRMAFSSILIKFMKSGPGAPRDGADKRIGRGIPSRFFGDRVRELAASLATLEAALPANAAVPVLMLGDARAYVDTGSRTMDLIVTSPPYAGTYDYAEHHEVRFRWLGLPLARFRNRQVGARAVGLGADPDAWAADRKRWSAEAARALRPGGYALFVVGDGVVGARAENAAQTLREACEPVGLAFIARASEERPPTDRRLADIFAGQPRREHLVLFRKR